ncbi:uncharacterized protein LOC135845651 isoform X2 [Planococcus citri]|uniref:uncharacterized protein LOC135845651 isoform X2 n=1 Tax=Planococcus citri TaxID=170843 RepID=UPI0031F9B91A
MLNKRQPGLQLEFILQGGSLRNTQTTDEINMIGAMPAVAVRHERRRQEKRNKRPSLLYLQSTQSRSTSPSPVQSSPGLYSAPQLEIYILGKISLLHIAVVTMLAGAVTLFVGLVQLKPGAEASQYRYVLIGSGLLCTLLGTILAVIRCCLLPWVARRREQQRTDRRKQRESRARERASPSKTSSDNKIEESSSATAAAPTPASAPAQLPTSTAPTTTAQNAANTSGMAIGSSV